MAISNSSNYISDLLNAGNDAFSNLYEVTFALSDDYKDIIDSTTFTMRCKDFTPPSVSGGDTPTEFVTLQPLLIGLLQK